ncbi:hypothetical protein SteCoe_14880 [Stentor coeruleus]|uniref:Uncharacterized protein n=1 Tax=Stentor coeruleus TaxID=5963 RepID=A0A1R2C517_9CILI|nr:hypothetical protein SteCoe_14880 [Stentor coeruleus]
MDFPITQRGRKLHKFTKILREFFQNRAKKSKKDNFKLCIMRKFIKYLGLMVKGRYPKIYGLVFDLRDENQCHNWQLLTQIYRLYPKTIESAINTSNSPCPESKTKNQNNQNKQNKQKTYNKEFIRSFFEDIILRNAFRIFLDLIFNPDNCKGLCCEFEFSCCERQEKSHTDECREKWMNLKNYYSYEFFNEIEVKLSSAEMGESRNLMNCFEEGEDNFDLLVNF